MSDHFLLNPECKVISWKSLLREWDCGEPAIRIVVPTLDGGRVYATTRHDVIPPRPGNATMITVVAFDNISGFFSVEGYRVHSSNLAYALKDTRTNPAFELNPGQLTVLREHESLAGDRAAAASYWAEEKKRLEP
jgi:hypothetical protein